MFVVMMEMLMLNILLHFVHHRGLMNFLFYDFLFFDDRRLVMMMFGLHQCVCVLMLFHLNRYMDYDFPLSSEKCET